MLFDIIPDNFFGPLAAPGKRVYWECICRLFAVTSKQLSFKFCYNQFSKW